MKIIANDSFEKSIRRIEFQNSIPYKIFDFLKRGIPRFFKNIWYFRKEMYEFSWWDYRYNLTLFRKSLEMTCHSIEVKGIEIDETRMKKVHAMKELIEILKTIESDDYIDLAEKELGKIKSFPMEFKPCEDHHDCYELVDDRTEEEKEHNRLVFSRSYEIEENYWNRMARIIVGQSREELKNGEDYDGTGMRGWWD
jgi:hypothetical protein